jgi:cobaltochelatase CobN
MGDGHDAPRFSRGAEIAATLDNLAAFAQLSAQVPAHLFDLTFEATLGRRTSRSS